MSDEIMSQYVIYERPRDYPLGFVVRRWRIVRGNMEPQTDGQPHALALTLEGARRTIPWGLFCIPRRPDDDPAIVEVWL